MKFADASETTLKPSDAMLTGRELLHEFRSIGFSNIIVLGGLFRDAHLGVPVSDIDVRIQLDSSFDDTIDRLRSSRLLTDVAEGEVSVMGGGYLRYRPKASFEGIALDLIFEEAAWSPMHCVLSTDATINSFSLCPDTKKVMSHRNAMRDLELLVYSPIEGNGHKPEKHQERFDHLRQKLPGLTYGRPVSMNNGDFVYADYCS